MQSPTSAVQATIMLALPQGSLPEPQAEEVMPAEVREAWFTILKAAHCGAPRPGLYYSRSAWHAGVVHWIQEPLHARLMHDLFCGP